VIRCFLSLVSVAALAATASAQCTDGRCQVPRAAVVPAAYPTAGPVLPAAARPEAVVSLYPAFLRPIGVTRVDVVFGPQARSRTLFRPFGGRFRR
jgi:hypothetical protein